MQGNFDAINALAGEITQVSFTDGSPALTLTDAQYNGSATLRGVFQASYALTVTGVLASEAVNLVDDTHVVHLTIADTSANVQTNLAALGALSAVVTQVSFTDQSPALTLTEAQYSAMTGLLGDFVGAYALTVTGAAAADAATIGADAHVAHLTISDTSSNVQTNFTALNALGGKITAVAFTDGAPALTLTAAQYNASLTLRAAFPENYSLTVTGEAAAQATALANDSHVTQFTILDSASAVQGQFDTLNGLASEIANVTFTDDSPALALTDAQYNASASLRGHFQASYALTVTGALASEAAALANNPHVAHFTIADSSANVQTQLSTLNPLANVITEVTFTDQSPALTVTEAQYQAMSALIGDFVGAYSLNVTGVAAADAAAIGADSHVAHLTISDTAADVQTNFAALNALAGKITAVAFTDGSPALTLTGAQYDASAILRSAFPASYALTVTGAAAADAGAFASDSHVAHFSISDSAAQVQTAFDALNGLTAKVLAVSFTDVSPSLILTESQYNASTVLRADFPNAYTLTLTGVVAADATTLASDPHVAHLAIVDSSANIQTNLTALDALASKITAVTFTDDAPTLTLTKGQYDASTALRGEFQANYALNVTGVAAAAAAALALDSHVLHLAISDTSANLQANYNAVAALAGKVSSVAFTDVSPTLTITEAQYEASSSLRVAFPASYSLEVTGVAAADAAGIAADSHVTQITVADTSAAVQSSYDALNGLTKIAAVSFTDGSPALSLSEAQYAASTSLRAEFSANYALTITSAAAADATTLAGDGHVAHLAILDSAANIQANLVALDALAATISLVTFTDGSPALTLTEAQYNSATALLGKFPASYTLTVTGVAAADAAAIAANSHVGSLTISDASAALQTNFDSVDNIAAKVSAINFTDGAPSLTISETQYAASSTLRAAFSSPYALAVTAVAAADAAAIAADGHVTVVSILDTAAHVQNALNTLESVVNHVQSISLSDAQSPTLTMSEAQYLADWGALQKIASSFNVTITGVAAADVASMITTVEADANIHSLAINVSDSAAHIAAALDTLNAPEVQAITVVDNAALVFSAGAAANGASALSKLANQDMSHARARRIRYGGSGERKLYELVRHR